MSSPAISCNRWRASLGSCEGGLSTGNGGRRGGCSLLPAAAAAVGNLLVGPRSNVTRGSTLLLLPVSRLYEDDRTKSDFELVVDDSVWVCLDTTGFGLGDFDEELSSWLTLFRTLSSSADLSST